MRKGTIDIDRPARYPAAAFKRITDSDYGVAAIIRIPVRAGKSIGPCPGVPLLAGGGLGERCGVTIRKSRSARDHQCRIRFGFAERAPPAGQVKMRAVGSAGRCIRARPFGRGSGARSAGVQQQRGPRNRRRKSGHFAKHDFNDVTDGVGGILRSAATTQPAIDEQLQQIEG